MGDDVVVVMALGVGLVLVYTDPNRAVDSKDCARAADLDSCYYCRSPMPRKAEGYDSHRTPSLW